MSPPEKFDSNSSISWNFQRNECNFQRKSSYKNSNLLWIFCVWCEFSVFDVNSLCLMWILCVYRCLFSHRRKCHKFLILSYLLNGQKELTKPSWCFITKKSWISSKTNSIYACIIWKTCEKSKIYLFKSVWIWASAQYGCLAIYPMGCFWPMWAIFCSNRKKK